MEKAYANLKRWATLRNAFIALALLIVNIVVLGMSDRPLEALASGQPKLDLRFGYDLETVMSLFSAYGESGRQLYFWNLVIDMPFPILVAVATVLFVALALDWPIVALLLCVAPAVFMITDLTENILFVSMLRAYPDIDPRLVVFASGLTRVKRVGWYASAVTFLLAFVIVLVRLLVKLIKPRQGSQVV
jgi:hypothetical protein